MVLYVLWVHHDTGLHKENSPPCLLWVLPCSVSFVMGVASSDPHGVIPDGIFLFLK